MITTSVKAKSRKPRPQFRRQLRNILGAISKKVIVVGDRSTTKQISVALDNGKTEIVWLPDIRGLESKVDPSSQAIFFAEPVIGVCRAIRNLKSNDVLENIPVHVVVTDMSPADNILTYYKLGAESVVKFPEESAYYSNFLKKLKRMKAPKELSEPGDIRSTRAIKARIATVMGSLRKVNVWCRNGVVHFIGQVPSIKKKEEIETIMAKTPGVKELASSGFRLPQNELTDNELDERLNELIKSLPNVPRETVSCSVTNGGAVLAGNVADHSTLRRLNKRVFALFGLKSIRNFISVSKERVRLDKMLAHNIQKAINYSYDQSMVNVTVLDKHVILKGRVRNNSNRQLIEGLVHKHGQFDRVINNLKVNES